jgi:hypothetical protein
MQRVSSKKAWRSDRYERHVRRSMPPTQIRALPPACAAPPSTFG